MKHKIEIPDLPEGWEAVEFRLGEADEPYYDPATKSICRLLLSSSVGVMIVRKKQPRRIVLEETGEVRKPKAGEYIHHNGNYCFCRKPDRWGNEHEIWKIVEDDK